ATRKLVVDSGHLERIVRWGMASDRATSADVMAEVMVTDLRGDLERIEAPVDVVYAWEKAGHVTRAGVYQVYAAAYQGLSNGWRLLVDHARHCLMFDQLDAFYDEVRDWLASKKLRRRDERTRNHRTAPLSQPQALQQERVDVCTPARGRRDGAARGEYPR